MENKKFLVSQVQKLLCWAALVGLAWNPENCFQTLIENLGVKIPFFMAAAGAGSDFAKGVLTGAKDLTNLIQKGGKP